MLIAFEKHIKQHFPELYSGNILIAVSGGVDSMVLTTLLHQLSMNLSIAHCNFKLRAAHSDLDESLVMELAEQLGIDAFHKSFDTLGYAKKNGTSIQMAARSLRYNWFEELLKENHLDFLITAHHLDDQLETFFINFTRGTGLDGLVGIPSKNGHILRPLLPFSKEEIIRFAKSNNLIWREDQSNQSDYYKRNKIRLQIVPVLKELNPSLLTSFNNTLNYLKESQQFIDDQVQLIKSEVCSSEGPLFRINIQKLCSYANHKLLLFHLLKEFNFTEWDDVNQLLSAQTGKYIISKTHRILKDRDELIVSRNADNKRSIFTIRQDQAHVEHMNLVLKINEIPIPKDLQTHKNLALIDKDLIQFPFTIRSWQHGDSFYPLGMQNKKKLSNFFTDQKISILEKEQLWLLCNSDQNIIWVIGYRLDDRYKISPSTKSVLSIEATFL